MPPRVTSLGPFDEPVGRLRRSMWADWTSELPPGWIWILLLWMVPLYWMADFVVEGKIFSAFQAIVWWGIAAGRNKGRRESNP